MSDEFVMTTDRILGYGDIRITLTEQQANDFENAVTERPTPFWYDFAAVKILIGNGVPITLQRRVEGVTAVTTYDFAARERGEQDPDAPRIVLSEDLD